MATSEMEMRTALDQHWAASAAGDLEAEHDIYHDDAICDYPQSGELALTARSGQAPSWSKAVVAIGGRCLASSCMVSGDGCPG